MSDLQPPENNIELDHREITGVRSILRYSTNEMLSPNNTRKCVSWKDELSDSPLHLFCTYPAEEEDVIVIDEELEEERVEKSKERKQMSQDEKKRKELILDYNDSICSDKVNGEERRHDEADRKRERKKNSRNEGGRTKKKEEGRPPTEEEVLAEIGRKIMDAGEKATRMKEQKREEAERRREKKNDEKRKREEKKKRKKEKEIGSEKEEKGMDRKPKSRAEAARRTKALLAMESENEGRSSLDDMGEEDDDEPKKKKRKYRKRTKPLPFVSSVKDANEEEGVHAGCGKYINNPNDVTMQTMCKGTSLEDEEPQGDGDEILSVPFVWMSCEEDSRETIQPTTFHPHHHMKGHVKEVEELSHRMAFEHGEMATRLEGMKLNLFADTTLRRFDSRVLRNIDLLSATGMWPDDLLPQPNRLISKCQYLMWNPSESEPNPAPSKLCESSFPQKTRFVRVDPSHKKKDDVTSEEMDVMSGAAAERVTKRDMMRNVEELVRSKWKKTSWTPLPNSGNPFDVPEILTRRTMRTKEYQSASHVQKMPVVYLPCENSSKRRKKTRKEVLLEMASRPRRIVEESEQSIYKEDMREGGEEDGYQYEWDEMGEIIENPMRDHHIHEDAIGHSYEG
ncbi:hypothetical protein PMAYCL1PPCAC_29555, partial [Pristionchus mayeri]